MLSYIGKFIILLSVLYTLLIPSAIINAFADENLTIENSLPQERERKDNLTIRVNESNKKNDIQKADNISETELPVFFTKNIQTVGNILSSSSSELVEKAKSYALGKFNSTIASEAQKWLSQFGTAKINFGLDRKGKLENNSLDLLLPLYDNKTDWLLFSQLGYRNKDSRNTVNLGLGGRYFYQNWMYGLNTFYDHDLTGKNKRIGFGGEIWGDYIKLSANTYRRLSDWQISRNFEEHHERPANGYDINGEFFLPAYPNLGGKLSYEQYFGENVTLFNRHTKQKNPSLVKLGVTYTPIPLITMGVDYRQGEGGRSETQFLANLNYRLGVPLGTQLSPENVAAMRTLAGSRYELVERNNNIVLDHKKIPIAQFSVPETIVGYSHMQKNISAIFPADASIKQVHWAINEEKIFESKNGKLSSKVGKSIQITLPKFSLDEKNNYSIYVFAELTNGKKIGPKQIQALVMPFMVKKWKEGEPVYIIPERTSRDDGKATYILKPVMTFDTEIGAPVPCAIIENYQWATEPHNDLEIKIEKGTASDDCPNIDNSKSSGDKIPLTTDKHGRITQKVTLTSDKNIGNVNVYLTTDGVRKSIGKIGHEEGKKPTIQSMTLEPSNGSVLPGGSYKIIATISGTDDKNKIPVKWKLMKPQNAGLSLSPSEETTTVSNEKLTATLTSSSQNTPPGTVAEVCLTINGVPESQKTHKCIEVKFKSPPVDFDIAWVKPINFDKDKPLLGDGSSAYTFEALIVKKGTAGTTNEPIEGNTFSNVLWTTEPDQKSIHQLQLHSTANSMTTGTKKDNKPGILTITLTSKVGIGYISAYNSDSSKVGPGVNVTLTMQDPKGLPVHKTSAHVIFKPKDEPAGILLYNVLSDNQEPQKKILTQDGRPHSAFPSIAGQLIKLNSGDFVSTDNDYVGYDIDGGHDLYSIIIDGNGKMRFLSPGNPVITLFITKPNKSQHAYKYIADIKKYYAIEDTTMRSWNDNPSCKNFNEENVTLEDITHILGDEYGKNKLYDWGLLGGNTQNKDNAKILVTKKSVSDEDEYGVYDLISGKFISNKNTLGFLLCIRKP
ncbi:inverse autotransporter beta domain-containing protein [Xenorhabdus indica]|uniref:inverse autotransporter beta domain-containing protein n=1 Tax=Xenorhabdus indica TaxID=333964 RepID=UPI001656AAED|nr:inverse autotransporter beta domain-containing protein [Xenorhabdus indica]MBC8945425.1 putative invasin [Xenorhabdus indica]